MTRYIKQMEKEGLQLELLEDGTRIYLRLRRKERAMSPKVQGRCRSRLGMQLFHPCPGGSKHSQPATGVMLLFQARIAMRRACCGFAGSTMNVSTGVHERVNFNQVPASCAGARRANLNARHQSVSRSGARGCAADSAKVHGIYAVGPVALGLDIGKMYCPSTQPLDPARFLEASAQAQAHPGSMSEYLVDTADDGEQCSDDSSNPQDQPWMTASILDDTPSPASNAHESIGAFRQLWGQDQTSLLTEIQQNNNLQYHVAHSSNSTAEDRRPPECIDPSALTMPDPHYGSSPGFVGYDDRYPRALAEDWNEGGSTICFGAPGNPSDDDAAKACARTALEYPSAIPVPFDNQDENYGGPDSNFIPGVLGRQIGHREALGVDTARLMTRLCVRNDDGGHAPLPPNVGYDNVAVDSSQETVLPPQCFGNVQTQQSLVEYQQLPGVILNDFQYVVWEGTPVDVDLNVTGSMSTRKSSGWPHPEVVSQHSGDAPSPPSTAANTDGLDCPRHLRLKHGETIVQYPCEDDYCTRRFNRKDARLKHYRKAHPHLSPGPPVLRGSPSLPESD
ncbi:uncharacterized protein M421DRAFT_90651 [Didymella exigua CBS 183.55]|uniref:C2H2-type domain-containing protein n=1 Tax=Didymella exigua CBS 183.55 TaxID=1150837 RepID=A0A6A5RQY0_9PLEO|nr:uncharacterized protein M421DRAFT_90651 [Didymella exigua CBS 183.55]KAF1930851.1 hypothetical protein M421DRAFT_90651 [Didymella exigua CBS 183.55]